MQQITYYFMKSELQLQISVITRIEIRSILKMTLEELIDLDDPLIFIMPITIKFYKPNLYQVFIILHMRKLIIMISRVIHLPE